MVKHKKSGTTLTYGQLCRKAALNFPSRRYAPLKKESEFRYIGKPMARVDIPDKVAGTAVYGLDVNVPDMLIAVIARPPVYGAKPGSYDEKAAMAVKGVQKVAPTPNGIAVIADSTACRIERPGRLESAVGCRKSSRHERCVDRKAFHGRSRQAGRRGPRNEREMQRRP